MELTQNSIQRIIVGVAALFIVLVGLTFFAPIDSVSAVGDASKLQACDAIGGCDDEEGKIDNIVSIVITTISVIAGVLAVIMIIVSGMKYITSGGDSSKITSAKNSLIYAVIGLVIVVLSQVIVRFVLDKATTPTQTPPAATSPNKPSNATN